MKYSSTIATEEKDDSAPSRQLAFVFEAKGTLALPKPTDSATPTWSPKAADNTTSAPPAPVAIKRNDKAESSSKPPLSLFANSISALSKPADSRKKTCEDATNVVIAANSDRQVKPNEKNLENNANKQREKSKQSKAAEATKRQGEEARAAAEAERQRRMEARLEKQAAMARHEAEVQEQQQIQAEKYVSSKVSSAAANSPVGTATQLPNTRDTQMSPHQQA